MSVFSNCRHFCALVNTLSCIDFKWNSPLFEAVDNFFQSIASCCMLRKLSNVLADSESLLRLISIMMTSGLWYKDLCVIAMENKMDYIQKCKKRWNDACMSVSSTSLIIMPTIKLTVTYSFIFTEAMTTAT